MVNVLDPAPGAAKEAGANDAVTPEGRPLMDNATAELNPPETEVATATAPCAPRARVREGVADKLSDGVDGDVGGAGGVGGTEVLPSFQ